MYMYVVINCMYMYVVINCMYMYVINCIYVDDEHCYVHVYVLASSTACEW